jgi:hypothetical protein
MLYTYRDEAFSFFWMLDNLLAGGIVVKEFLGLNT